MKQRAPRAYKKILKKKIIKGTGYTLKECKINGFSTHERHLKGSRFVYKSIAVRAYSLGY